MKPERRRGYVETTPNASDPRLRGRTYAVPFEEVWQAALALTGGGLFRWTRHEADDTEGVILASSKSLAGAVHDVMVRVTLDEDGQTRVDASAQARRPLSDMGRSRRRLRRFFRALDRTIARARRDAARKSRPESART
ncbi:MAG TPA: DUF1499 domain-containing protein [Longimicrobiales bacterium]|nr:DUF1499 domain-containing protein [Longimicrobiales bacterium]